MVRRRVGRGICTPFAVFAKPAVAPTPATPFHGNVALRPGVRYRRSVRFLLYPLAFRFDLLARPPSHFLRIGPVVYRLLCFADDPSLGICEDGLRDKAIASIVNRHTPAIIGTGWLSHYPLAFGYATQQRTVRKCFIFCWDETVTDRFFYVNQGWGGGGAGDWVEASTWFCGQLYP